MNKLFLTTVLLFSIIHSTFEYDYSKKSFVKQEKPIENYEIVDDLYSVNLTIENNVNPILNIDVKLKKDSFFVSPNAKRDFKGKFFMDFGEYKNIEFSGKLTETPLSKEETDLHPFVGGLVNWVRVNTVYKQHLKLKTTNDFEVFGRIKFVIEPRCTLEEIPFGIRYKNGKFSFFKPSC